MSRVRRSTRQSAAGPRALTRATGSGSALRVCASPSTTPELLAGACAGAFRGQPEPAHSKQPGHTAGRTSSGSAQRLCMPWGGSLGPLQWAARRGWPWRGSEHKICGKLNKPATSCYSRWMLRPDCWGGCLQAPGFQGAAGLANGWRRTCTCLCTTWQGRMWCRRSQLTARTIPPVFATGTPGCSRTLKHLALQNHRCPNAQHATSMPTCPCPHAN